MPATRVWDSAFLGFLPDYAKEEGLQSGSRYFLLTLARNTFHAQALPTGAFYIFSALLLLGLAIWAFLRAETQTLGAIRACFVIATALMLLFSSHYPWYYLWLLPFLTVIPYTPMIYFSTACFYLYTTELANPGPAMYYMFQWLYGTTAVLALWCAASNWLARKQGGMEFNLGRIRSRNS